MELRDVLPRHSLVNAANWSLSISEYGLSDIEEIIQLKPQSMFEIGAAIWDRFVRLSSGAIDPRTLSDAFDESDPRLYKMVEAFIGNAAITDLYYAHATVNDAVLIYQTASELLVAECYPGVLHLSDIEFSNPYKPLSVSQRVSRFQHYQGLGLLPELMARVEQCARERTLSALTLTAAGHEHIPLFRRYGFEVDQTPAGQHGLAAGTSIPMSKVL